MPDLLTPQALATAGPLVLETFFRHFFSPKGGIRQSQARDDDLLYDEAFVIMKSFLELATKHPVAALQRFGLVRTPAPPQVALHRISVPQSTLSVAAEYLISALGGDEMAYKIAGGTKWWQVRAGSGVEAEWIVMKKDWREYRKMAEGEQEGRSGQTSRRGSGAPEGMVGEDGGENENGQFREEMNELRCMLYIHGGAYYWGSINTHRYTIWRYARKMHGRCFAVNYRKAPQYPFPCAIQDCLAAYLYLVDPPPEAEHTPIDPKNIVIGGDSAGGGLVLALLQILRDTDGLSLPAGAVLISPWSDLTHSFPSILSNTATDIIPPYSFIHKPSSLWPPPPPQLTDEIQGSLRHKVKEVVHNLRHHGQPSAPESAEQMRRASLHTQANVNSTQRTIHQLQLGKNENGQNNRDESNRLKSSAPGLNPSHHDPTDDPEEVGLHPTADKGKPDHNPGPRGEPSHAPSRANPALLFQHLRPRDDATAPGPTTLAQCNTPLDLEVDGQPVSIDTQVQLYATNAQLCHPWVSPVLGYMGGLPPLYICAGDNEVLRDEIIYLAHKAANPDAYPIREDVRALLPSLQGIEEKHGPTDVHLQVFDGTCHDLPLFSMAKPARGVFRAISTFIRYCTPSAPGSMYVSRTPTQSQYNSPIHSPALSPHESETENTVPILERPVVSTPPLVLSPTQSTITFADLGDHPAHPASTRPEMIRASSWGTHSTSTPSGIPHKATRFGLTRRTSSNADQPHPVASGSGSGSPSSATIRRGASSYPSGDDAGPRFGDDFPEKESRAGPGEAGWPGIYRGPIPFTNHMIRERVSPDGHTRPLEPPSELGALTMPSDEIGMLKEGPAIRYLNGQALYAKKYRHTAKRVEKRRLKNIRNATEKDGKKLERMWGDRVSREKEKVKQLDLDEGWETDIAEGAADDLDGRGLQGATEGRKGRNPIGGSGDILDQSWSWTWALHGEAPPPSAIVSRRDFSEARNLALMADRMDDHSGPSIGGLSIWVGLAAFFSTSSDRDHRHSAARADHHDEGHRALREVRPDGLINESRSTGEMRRDGGAKGKNRAGKNRPRRSLGLRGLFSGHGHSASGKADEA